jgi:hypothetical protein
MAGQKLMKTPFVLLTAGWVFISAAANGAETAQARLYCVSLQCQTARATGEFDGANWTLNLTTLPSSNNGELAPFFLTTSYTHSAYVRLYNDLTEMSDSGKMAFDVPSNVGIDGFPILFEVSQGVTNLTSAGAIVSDSGNGFYPSPGVGFSATWNRPAGSATGTCSFQLPDPDTGYYYNLQYAFSFTILEYTGPLTYTPGSNTVSATIVLTQTGNPGNTLQGPIIFVKSTADRFNVLTNQPGVWTNAASQLLGFDDEIFSRDATWPTNYAGFVYFAYGDPSTTDPDYQLWVLSIDDTNDVNANGIPDFSDDPTVAPPRAPQLVLTPGTTNLWLAISGDKGHTNLIQEIGLLTATNWQTTLSLVLTNDPQVISLPLPAAATKFWRVLAQ